MDEDGGEGGGEEEDYEEPDVVWPEVTNLKLGKDGRLNLKDQKVKVRALLEAAMRVMVEWTGVKDAYPNLKRKSKAVKLVLLHAAKAELPEAKERIECSREYVSKIANMVRYLHVNPFIVIPLRVLDFDQGYPASWRHEVPSRSSCTNGLQAHSW
jgi:hypothetical protein